MTQLRSFNEVKIQWLRLLAQDSDLNPRAVQIALYIVMVRLNGRTHTSKTAHSVVARDLDISTKTVQRSIRELRAKWFLIETGKCCDLPTLYRINPVSHAEAHNLREEQEAGKADKIVHLRDRNRRQKCPERRTDVSMGHGQKRPPNIESSKIRKEKRSAPDLPHEGQSGSGLVFVPGGGGRLERDWDDCLRQHGFGSLSRSLPEVRQDGRRGYMLPALGPAPALSGLLREQLAAIRALVDLVSDGERASDVA